MEENVKVDKEYIKDFNLGYELAKELNLISPMFKDLDQNNTRLQAMQAGMVEFCNETTQVKNKDLGLNSNQGIKSEKDKGKGFNLSI